MTRSLTWNQAYYEVLLFLLTLHFCLSHLRCIALMDIFSASDSSLKSKVYKRQTFWPWLPFFSVSSIYLERWWYGAQSEGHSDLSAPASSRLIGPSSVALAKRSYSLSFLQNVFPAAVDSLLLLRYRLIGELIKSRARKVDLASCLQRQLTQQCIKIRLDSHIKKRAKVGSRGPAKDQRSPCMWGRFAWLPRERRRALLFVSEVNISKFAA